MSKNWWEEYKVDVPEGTDGVWSVSKFTVSKKDADFENMRASFSFSSGGQHILPGTYTQLKRGGTLVMSDTPSEIRDHMSPINRATGEVLIAGLGLGMVVKACLKKPEVTRVTVVELAPEVIHLVGDHMKGIHGDRLNVVQADIFKWEPPKGVRWDVAWFDIWDDICMDNLDEMATLNRRFGRRVAWKGCWRRESLLSQRRRDKASGWY